MRVDKNLVDQVQFISRGSIVRRFHQHPQLVQDTDGRHSHGVFMLCILLCDGAPSVNLLMACGAHDLAEQIVGDVPAPTKRRMKKVFDLGAYEGKILHTNGFSVALTAEEVRALKFADALDGMLACARELAMGNRTVVWMYRKWLTWLKTDFGDLSMQEYRLLGAVDTIWKRAMDRDDAGYEDNTAVEEEA